MGRKVNTKDIRENLQFNTAKYQNKGEVIKTEWNGKKNEVIASDGVVKSGKSCWGGAR